jgi:hypothetical protein
MGHTNIYIKNIKSLFLTYFFKVLATRTLLFCLRTLTLNLSKSLRALLLALRAIFLPVADSVHFLSRPKSSIAFFRATLLTPLETGRTKSVSWSLLTEISCLLTPVVGPSTRTLVVLRISTITTNLPVRVP